MARMNSCPSRFQLEGSFAFTNGNPPARPHFSHEVNNAYLFTNDSYKYFELDSGARIPHSGIASRTSTVAVIAKHSFVAGSVAALQIS
jgi:hypothetical protein